jgi:hypothetical protein
VGFWDFGKKQPDPEKVCIPEARQKIEKEEAEKKRAEEERKALELARIKSTLPPEMPTFNDNKPRLYIEGIFSVVDTLMVKGTVASGKITKQNKIKIKKKIFKVKDLQFKGRSVGSITMGQKGAVFFDKAKGLSFKTEDIITFI